MSDLTLTYALVGRGTARATISAGDQQVTLFASYLSDALGDLARATVVLLREAPPVTVSFSWQDEPGEYRWIVRRDDGNVSIRILRFDDTFSRRPNEEGNTLFECAGPLLRWVRQVKSLLHRLLMEVGAVGYQQTWVSHEFPMDELEELAALFDGRKRSTLEPD